MKEAAETGAKKKVASKRIFKDLSFVLIPILLIVGLVIVFNRGGSDPDLNASINDLPSKSVSNSSASSERKITKIPDLCKASLATNENVRSHDLKQLSGLAASQIHPGIFWTVNDTAGQATLYALDKDGRLKGQVSLGKKVNDLESIAIAPAAGGAQFIYFADTGQKGNEKSFRKLYRAVEPNFKDEAVANVETFSMEFTDGAIDIEALIVDPITNEVLTINKQHDDKPALVHKGKIVAGEENIAMDRVAKLDFIALQEEFGVEVDPTSEHKQHLVTGADITTDGGTIGIRTYGNIWLFSRIEGENLEDAFKNQPCKAESEAEAQGEAIAFSRDGNSYVTVSERFKKPINIFSKGS